MESQQLATRVASLESRVAALEDEGKIVKGEVKQVLTEIRTAVLARENPFDTDTASRPPASASVAVVAHDPVAKVELVMPQEQAHQPDPEPQPARQPEPPSEPAPEPAPSPAREPVMLRPPAAAPEPQPQPEPRKLGWSLLTIAGVAAWAEDAVRRLGPLRLEILLDMVEASGHLTPEARAALSRVVELDVDEPAQPPSTNETVLILRQLDALVNEDEDRPSIARAA